MYKLIAGIILLCSLNANTQTIADFENFDLDAGSFLDGSTAMGSFESGGIVLPNDYSFDYDSWLGWAISSSTDTTTPGFQNQYSSIAGSGFDGSNNYAVSFSFGANMIQMKNNLVGNELEGMYISNSTYAYLSMRDGDSFAKKFGGITGDDPDFFLLTIKGYRTGEMVTDSIDFYLADYRFEDNTEDYIVDTWEFVDLRSLGEVDSLSLSLSSSDNGQFGMNTPAYFCMDNLESQQILISTKDIKYGEKKSLAYYPNPAQDFIHLDLESNVDYDVEIRDMNGNQMILKSLKGKESMDIQNIPSGIFIIAVRNDQSYSSELFIKH